jgi:hypothetical protein
MSLASGDTCKALSSCIHSSRDCEREVMTKPGMKCVTYALRVLGVVLGSAGCSLVAGNKLPLGNSQGPTIVNNGEGRAVIVAAAGDSHAQQAAAAIQKYVGKISGATLAIFEEGREQPTASDSVTLYVGHTEAAKSAGIDIPAGHDPSIRADAFKEEGYVLKTVGNKVFIGGNSDGSYRGTIYGAYAFLEKLGCRWYFPGEWGEIVPRRETVTVPHLDVLSRPDFAIRRIGIGSWVKATPEERKHYETDWCDKIAFNGGQFESYPGVGDGYLGRLLPFTEYYDTHPEYYAMNKKGVRGKPERERHTMLCLSNPEVLAESIRRIEEVFASGQHEDYSHISHNGIGISPPDGSPYCYCVQCEQASQKFEYPKYVYGPQMSDEFFSFACKIAEAFPNKWIATMAYALREMPPQGVSLLPNMTVFYAPISCCALHDVSDASCWRRQEFRKLLTQWRRQTPHVYLYEYTPNFLSGLFIPELGVTRAANAIPIYNKIDIKGISAEGRKAFMQTWITYYVTAKLLWDATADVEALQDEFYMNFFGPDAGPHVRAWWDACEEALRTASVHVHEDFLINHIYNEAFTQRIHKHVDAALNCELSAEQQERVDAFALIADHLEAYAKMEAADMELRYDDAVAAAQRMIDDKHKLNQIYSYFISPREKPTGALFSSLGRKQIYEALAAMTGGERGTLVVALPLEMRFRRDSFNEGVIGEWYADDIDDTRWDTRSTFHCWDAQDEPEDDEGHDYDGYGWYRGTFEVPEAFTGKTINFYLGGAMNEAWIWINDKYVLRTPHRVWHHHPHDFGREEPINVTDFVKAGQRNTIAIRLWNKAEVGGLIRRGFFWSPVEEAKKEEVASSHFGGAAKWPLAPGARRGE